MSAFKTTILGVSLLALTACGTAEKISPEALITTPQGPVQGVSTDDDTIYNFKGVPFAAPPIGNLRWAAPTPAPKWSEAHWRAHLVIAVCSRLMLKAAFLQDL